MDIKTSPYHSAWANVSLEAILVSTTTSSTTSATFIAGSATNGTSTNHSVGGGAIAGIVIGSVAGIATLILGIVFVRKRRATKKQLGQGPRQDLADAYRKHERSADAKTSNHEVEGRPLYEMHATDRPGELVSHKIRHELEGNNSNENLVGAK